MLIKNREYFPNGFFYIYNLKQNYKIQFQNNYSVQEKKVKNVCGWSHDQIIKANSNFYWKNFNEFCQLFKKE
jgi:hypothetical protein